uniref:exodeoxyribonuclease III n=1 Tax=Latimeria chalumnae TaxID=7897 RepID=H3ATJ9_LATCH
MMASLTYVSWNINGINHPIKRKRILSFLRSHQVQVALLQETHLTQVEHEKLREDWVVFPQKAILISKNSPFHCLSQVTDPAGCFIIVHSRWGSKQVTFASLYAPNIDDPLVIQNFFLQLAQFPSPWVIGGDFNCALDTVMDRSSSVQVAQTHMAKTILASMKEYGLMDVWRHLHPTVRESHYSHVHQSFSRIDLLLISALLSHRVKACEFLPRFISDHSPVMTQLETPTSYRDPFGRLDSHLLTRDDFVGEIKSAIQEFFQFNHSLPSSPDMIWEAFKATIRGKIIAFSSACRKKFQQQMVSLEQELRGVETELYKNNLAENRKRVALLQHDLNKLSSAGVEKALLKIRSRFYARGDKAGKLLAWQLCHEEADRLIPSIRLQDGNTSFAPEATNGAFQKYYSALYSTQYDERSMRGSMVSFLDNIVIPALLGEQGERLDVPL